MSGRNIFLVLVALVLAVGVYVFVMDPGAPPVVPVEAPAVMAPRTVPPPSPVIEQPVEPVPALDDVANDAATEVERLKNEQEEMDNKPAPEAAEPAMR